jgi:hypothetical protein
MRRESITEELGVNSTSVFRMEALVSDKNGVFAKLEATVDADPTTVEEVEDLGDYEGVDKTETDKGRVTEEGGADRGTVRILNIP